MMTVLKHDPIKSQRASVINTTEAYNRSEKQQKKTSKSNLCSLKISITLINF